MILDGLSYFILHVESAEAFENKLDAKLLVKPESNSVPALSP